LILIQNDKTAGNSPPPFKLVADVWWCHQCATSWFVCSYADRIRESQCIRLIEMRKLERERTRLTSLFSIRWTQPATANRISCLLCLSATHCKTSAFEQSGVLLSSVLFSPIGPTSCRTVLCRVSRLGGVRLAILVSISTPSGIPCQMKCVPLTHDQLQILHWSKLRIFTELLLFCLVVAISQNSAVNNEFEANRR